MSTARRTRLKQFELLIALLKEGRTIGAISQIMCVHRARLYEWMQTPEFKSMHSQATVELVNAVKDGFNGGGPEALKLCRDIVTDIMIPKTDRFPAAKYLLDTGVRFAEALYRIGESDDEQLVPVKRSNSNE